MVAAKSARSGTAMTSETWAVAIANLTSPVSPAIMMNFHGIVTARTPTGALLAAPHLTTATPVLRSPHRRLLTRLPTLPLHLRLLLRLLQRLRPPRCHTPLFWNPVLPSGQVELSLVSYQEPPRWERE